MSRIVPLDADLESACRNLAADSEIVRLHAGTEIDQRRLFNRARPLNPRVVHQYVDRSLRQYPAERLLHALVGVHSTALLRNFDIFKEAGGEDRPIRKVFHSLQPNAQGKLVFSFVPVRNYACINAIEVVDEGR